jgi:hypothetical protein
MTTSGWYLPSDIDPRLDVLSEQLHRSKSDLVEYAVNVFLDRAEEEHASLLRRFWEKVEKSPGCWEWLGYCARSGHGMFQRSSARVYDLGPRGVLVHRFSYELHYGPIPPGVFVLHKCDNAPCVRPDHLYLGDQLQNVRDRVDRGRTSKGVDHFRSKLSEQDVRDIRARYAAGGVTHRELAQMYGVTHPVIGDVVNRVSYQGVSD